LLLASGIVMGIVNPLFPVTFSPLADTYSKWDLERGLAAKHAAGALEKPQPARLSQPGAGGVKNLAQPSFRKKAETNCRKLVSYMGVNPVVGSGIRAEVV
jgi:hypothetical protein